MFNYIAFLRQFSVVGKDYIKLIVKMAVQDCILIIMGCECSGLVRWFYIYGLCGLMDQN